MISELMQYKRWANDLFFTACLALDPPQWEAAQPIKFGSLSRTAQHVFDMDRVWWGHLTGASHGISGRTPDAALPASDLFEMQSGLDARYCEYADGLKADDHDRMIDFTFLNGQPGRMRIAQILVHVVNHNTYHRGHMADMFYHLGISPPVTDYPVFLRDYTPSGPAPARQG
ncbi:MAG: DinB family protein [Pseudomonadota bacterium]